jgi:hypothetical protein
MENIDDASVLVVVVNSPADLARAREQRWYRIPLAHLPRRMAAEYLAFYQTGAFPPGERWAVRWLAPVRGYHLATRRDLIPEEPDHPRADAVYYKVTLGPLEALQQPIPSRRLRRITFIPTTLARIGEAEEINDLWIKSSAQERLWAALQDAGVPAERQYPLEGEEPGAGDLDAEAASLPALVADFALPWPGGGVALIVTDEPRSESNVAEPQPPYSPALPGWRLLYVTQAEISGALGPCVEALAGPAPF